MFSTRILTTDHYLGPPVPGLDVTRSDFREADVKQVPVLRIFGITPVGQKTCMHVHGVFPYLYVPYDGTEPVKRFLRQFANSIDKALNVAVGKASATAQHVYKIVVVSGIPFYGYHEEEIPFLKIYLYNPRMVKKVADLLLGGAILNKIYQPYEAHIPYNLQMFMDYNLYGMNMVNVSAVKFRQNREEHGRLKSTSNEQQSSGITSPIDSASSSFNESLRTQTPSRMKWEHENIPSDYWLNIDVERQSTCELEVDIVAADILNQLEVSDNIGSNPGLAALWEDEKHRRQERGMSIDITPPSSPDRGDIPWTEAETDLQEKLREILEEMKPHVEKVKSSPRNSELSQLYPATPSSQVEVHHHLEQQEEDSTSISSNDTVMIEETPPEEHPVVSERSILRVVSSSQSFSREKKDLIDKDILTPAPTDLDNTQDQSIAELLASLARSNEKEAEDADTISTPGSSIAQSQALSQAIENRVEQLQDQDSILSQVVVTPVDSCTDIEIDSKKDEREDDVETLEMSQIIEFSDEESEVNDKSENKRNTNVFDLEGMDCSWNSSALMTLDKDIKGDESSGDDDTINIPQYDGPVEDKQVSVPLKKRLGIRGPATASFGMTVFSADGEATFKSSGSAKSIKIAEKKNETKDLKIRLTDISTLLGTVYENKGEVVSYIPTPSSPRSSQELSLDFRCLKFRPGSSPKREEDKKDCTKNTKKWPLRNSLKASSVSGSVINQTFDIKEKTVIVSNKSDPQDIKVPCDKPNQETIKSVEPTRRTSDRASKSKCVAFLKDVTSSNKKRQSHSESLIKNNIRSDTAYNNKVGNKKLSADSVRKNNDTLKTADDSLLSNREKQLSTQANVQAAEKGTIKESFKVDNKCPKFDNSPDLLTLSPKILCDKLDVSTFCHKLDKSNKPTLKHASPLCNDLDKCEEYTEGDPSPFSGELHKSKEQKEIHTLPVPREMDKNKEQTLKHEVKPHSKLKLKKKVHSPAKTTLAQVVKKKDRISKVIQNYHNDQVNQETCRNDDLLKTKNSISDNSTNKDNVPIGTYVEPKEYTKLKSLLSYRYVRNENTKCSDDKDVKSDSADISVQINNQDNSSTGGKTPKYDLDTGSTGGKTPRSEGYDSDNYNKCIITRRQSTDSSESEDSDGPDFTPRWKLGPHNKTYDSRNFFRQPISCSPRSVGKESCDESEVFKSPIVSTSDNEVPKYSDISADESDMPCGDKSLIFQSDSSQLAEQSDLKSTNKKQISFNTEINKSDGTASIAKSNIGLSEKGTMDSVSSSVYSTVKSYENNINDLDNQNNCVTEEKNKESNYQDQFIKQDQKAIQSADQCHLANQSDSQDEAVIQNEDENKYGNINYDQDNSGGQVLNENQKINQAQGKDLDIQITEKSNDKDKNIVHTVDHDQLAKKVPENDLNVREANQDCVLKQPIESSVDNIEQVDEHHHNDSELEKLNTLDECLDLEAERKVKTVLIKEQLEEPYIISITPLSPPIRRGLRDVHNPESIPPIFEPTGDNEPYIVSITPINTKQQQNHLSDEEGEIPDSPVFINACDSFIDAPIVQTENEVCYNQLDSSAVQPEFSDSNDDGPPELINEAEQVSFYNEGESDESFEDSLNQAPVLEPFEGQTFIDKSVTLNTSTCSNNESINDIEKQNTSQVNCVGNNFPQFLDRKRSSEYNEEQGIKNKQHELVPDILKVNKEKVLVKNSMTNSERECELQFEDQEEVTNLKSNKNSVTNSEKQSKLQFEDKEKITNLESIFLSRTGHLDHPSVVDTLNVSNSAKGNDYNKQFELLIPDTNSYREKTGKIMLKEKVERAQSVMADNKFSEGMKKISAAFKSDKETTQKNVSPLTVNQLSVEQNTLKSQNNKPKQPNSTTTLAVRKEKLRLKKEEKQNKNSESANQQPKRFDNAFQAAFNMLNQALQHPENILDPPSVSFTEASAFSMEVNKILGIELPDNSKYGKTFNSSEHERPLNSPTKPYPEKKLIKRKSFEERNRRTPDDCVSFPFSSKIRYVNGLSTANNERKTRHTSKSIEGEVKVLKQDCQEHDLRVIGKEKLVIPFMSVNDVVELKEQVKREVAHNKKEGKIILKKDSSPKSDYLNSTLPVKGIGEYRESTPFSEGDSEVSETEEKSVPKLEFHETAKDKNITIDLRGFTTCKMIATKEQPSSPSLKNEENSKSCCYTECIEMKRKEVVQFNSNELNEGNILDTVKYSSSENTAKVDVKSKNLQAIEVVAQQKSRERKERKSLDFATLFGTGDAIIRTKTFKKASSMESPKNKEIKKHKDSNQTDTSMSVVKSSSSNKYHKMHVKSKDKQHHNLCQEKDVNKDSDSACAKLNKPHRSLDSSVKDNVMRKPASKDEDKAHFDRKNKRSKEKDLVGNNGVLEMHNHQERETASVQDDKPSLEQKFNETNKSKENRDKKDERLNEEDKSEGEKGKERNSCHLSSQSKTSCHSSREEKEIPSVKKEKDRKSDCSHTKNRSDLKNKSNSSSKYDKDRNFTDGYKLHRPNDNERKVEKTVSKKQIKKNEDEVSDTTDEVVNNDNVKSSTCISYTYTNFTKVENESTSSETGESKRPKQETVTVQQRNISKVTEDQSVLGTKKKINQMNKDPLELNMADNTVSGNIMLEKKNTVPSEEVTEDVCDIVSPEDAINAILKISEDNKKSQTLGESNENLLVNKKESCCDSDDKISVKSDVTKSRVDEEAAVKPLHPQLLRTKGDSQNSSRRGSSTGSDKASEKGDSDVDFFSMLANIDSDISGNQSSDYDSHKQLHTPPLILDNSERANFERLDKKSTLGIVHSDNDMVKNECDQKFNTSDIDSANDKEETVLKETTLQQYDVNKDNESISKMNKGNCIENETSVINSDHQLKVENNECSDAVVLLLPEGPDEFDEDFHSGNGKPVSTEVITQYMTDSNVTHEQNDDISNCQHENESSKSGNKRFKLKRNFLVLKENTQSDEFVKSSSIQNELNGSSDREEGEITDNETKIVVENKSKEGKNECLNKVENRVTSKEKKKHKHHKKKKSRGKLDSRSSESPGPDKIDTYDFENTLSHRRKSHKRKKHKKEKEHDSVHEINCSSSESQEMQEFQDVSTCVNTRSENVILKSNDSNNEATSVFSEFRKRKSEERNSAESDVSPSKKTAVESDNTSIIESACKEESSDNTSTRSNKLLNSEEELLDEQEEEISSYNDVNQEEKKASAKKRKTPKRLDSAFCKPSAARKRKRTENKKFRDTLSILHQATLDNLKSDDSGSPSGCSEHSIEQIMSLKSVNNVGESSDSIKILSPNIETGPEKFNYPEVTVHEYLKSRVQSVNEVKRDGFVEDDNYCDTMYKLAYMSPVYNNPVSSPPCAKSPSHSVDFDHDLCNDTTKQILHYMKESGKSQYLSSMHVLAKFNNSSLTIDETKGIKTISERCKSDHELTGNKNATPEHLSRSPVFVKEIPGSPQSVNTSELKEISEFKSTMKMQESPLLLGGKSARVKEIPLSMENTESSTSSENCSVTDVFYSKGNETEISSQKILNTTKIIPVDMKECGSKAVCYNNRSNENKLQTEHSVSSDKQTKCTSPVILSRNQNSVSSRNNGNSTSPCGIENPTIEPDTPSHIKKVPGIYKRPTPSAPLEIPISPVQAKEESPASPVPVEIPKCLVQATEESPASPVPVEIPTCTVPAIEESPASPVPDQIPTCTVPAIEESPASPVPVEISTCTVPAIEESPASPVVDEIPSLSVMEESPASPENKHTYRDEDPVFPTDSPSSPLGNSHTMKAHHRHLFQTADNCPASLNNKVTSSVILKEIPSSSLQDAWIKESSERFVKPSPIRSRSPSPVSYVLPEHNSSINRNPVVIPLTIENFEPEYEIKIGDSVQHKQKSSAIKRKSPIPKDIGTSKNLNLPSASSKKLCLHNYVRNQESNCSANRNDFELVQSSDCSNYSQRTVHDNSSYTEVSENMYYNDEKDLTYPSLSNLLVNSGDSHSEHYVNVHRHSSDVFQRTCGTGKTTSQSCSSDSSSTTKERNRIRSSNSRYSKNTSRNNNDKDETESSNNRSHSNNPRDLSDIDRHCIITPIHGPPTRDTVLDECIHRGLTPQSGAFCSKPQDIPERPRELGGKILKIDSSLVKDLPEYTSSLEGLKHWQKVTLSSDTHDMTQGTIDEVVEQLDKQPQLRIAMFGDNDMIIMPSKMPPSLNNVKQWLKDRTMFRKLKETHIAESEKITIKNEKIPTVVEDDKVKKQYKKGPNFKYSKTKRPDASSVRECDFQPVSPPTQFCSILKSPDLGARGDHSTPTRRTSIISPPLLSSNRSSRSPGLKSPELLGSHGYSTRSSRLHKNTNDTSPEFVSSTPARRVSFENEIPLVTPIPRKVKKRKNSQDSQNPISKVGKSENEHDYEEDQEDVIPPTPKRLTPSSSLSLRKDRPVRRLSTGTDSTLRRVLLTSQLKNQFTSPVPSANPDISQIDGPTPKNMFGFKVGSQCVQDAKALHEFQYITVLSIELHVRTRGNYRPNPENDPVCAVFYSIFNDIPPEEGKRHTTGIILVNQFNPNKKKPVNQQLILEKSGIPSVESTYVETETELIEALVLLMKKWDPDILVGFEISMLSWGFLIQRANQLSIDLKIKLSRLPEMGKENKQWKEKDDDGAIISDITIPGRIVLNLWKILRHEVTLNIYNFENVMYHVLHKRVPLYSFKSLTFWYDHKLHVHRWRTIEYYITRSKGNLQLMENLDLIGQTSEFARVFGIEFYHVLSRGSQYRVESMMLRIAKPMNYIPVSPSVQQRSRMRAPECIPLTMEPQSKFYTDPVVVLDFQSLYPSIMIAHNYCFSTCIGRLEKLEKSHEGSFEFGCTSLNILPQLLDRLKNDINICPNGVCFVKEHIKKGILPRMVGDILKTRLMVKKSMKDYKGDKTLQKLLHARQLSLKLIANVTFGYTSANFSGRMPCMEIGDSIVRKARETLERAIELVHATKKWAADVVYGDTDSMFIQLKGRTKDEAFRIGQEIADAVTAANPKPIKLKFEKVYLPCVLQTKKRYVGFMYETVDQKEPVYDAKGIETVRRDSCAAVAKILEKSIKLLFTTHDISRVKDYVQKQWTKLSDGRVSIQDCVFAKEYRGMAGYKPGACVPALDIARRRLSKDPRSEPRTGERVPYVIVYGTPGLPLIQLVREPQELLNDPNLRINATYYITKQIIPPLMRIFMLMGIDVMNWYQELPRVVRSAPQGITAATDSKKGTISQYFHCLNCPVCDELTQKGMCVPCKTDPQRVAIILNSRIRKTEKTFFELYQVCTNCMGTQDSEIPCTSLDCPIMYRINRAARDMTQVTSFTQLQNKLLQF